MTSRELVHKTIEFANHTGRVPRNLWTLPWTELTYPEQLKRLREDFPSDFVDCGNVQYRKAVPTQGDPYGIGEYVDEWGCRFSNLHPGIIGEVKQPLVDEDDEDWEDTSAVHFPVELLDFDRDAANAFCRSTDKFVLGGCAARPFERMQFIRGTEAFYMDLALKPQGMLDFLKKLHAFNCDWMEAWAKTEVDALVVYDDWGAQNSLLINPNTWVELFKPLYRDYAEIAHRAGKKFLMHSDGHILDIYPHLIEIGVDALNSQIFCMGIDRLQQFAGRITFWGEIDRQQILPNGTPEQVAQAVRDVRTALWRNGGCIAQCEFGPGARPENVRAVFDTWNEGAEDTL